MVTASRSIHAEQGSQISHNCPASDDHLETSAARRHDLTMAYRLSSALVIVAASATAVGVVHPGIFRETAMTAGNARGTAFVILAIALPVMISSMFLTARGSMRAQIVWLGSLAYTVYNSVFFAYGIHFNSLFLLYAAMLGLSFWSIVWLLRAIDVDDLRTHFRANTPLRVFAGYLALINGPFVLLWLKDVVPGMLGNVAPAGLKGTGMITNPVQMTDFGFSFPLIALAVIWLWQGRSWGYLMAGAFLVYGVFEAVSVAVDQTFGHFSDPTQSLSAVPIFVMLALIGLVPVIVFLGYLKSGTPVEGDTL